MPVYKLEYVCLLISPSDVIEERDSLSEAIIYWNAHIGNALGARVELKRWESHSTPEFGKSPQLVLNEQLLDTCDIGIAVFWSRIGSPTEKYESGSIEEINILVERGKPVIIYFCTRDIPQDKFDNDQFNRLQELKRSYEKKGLIAKYGDITELREQFQLHLTSAISKLLERDKNYLSNPQVLTAPKPDVRIEVRNAIAYHPMYGHIDLITVDVQNHAPIPVYIGNVTIKLKNGDVLYFKDDPLTGEFQKKRKLESGQSFSFNITYDRIEREIDNLVNILIKDDIGRRYESDEEEFTEALNFLRNLIKNKK